MEPQFQKTFIPKKPFGIPSVGIPRPSEEPRRRRRRSLFLSLTTLIFLVVAVMAGSIFLYEQYLLRDIKAMQDSLEVELAEMEDDFLIRMLTLDDRLESSKELLSEHIAVTPIFDLFESVTLPGVQFSDFSYKQESAGGDIVITTKGRAVSYSAVALQSDLFIESDKLIEPLFHNLDVNTLGQVIFSFRAKVKPELVKYNNLASQGI